MSDTIMLSQRISAKVRPGKKNPLILRDKDTDLQLKLSEKNVDFFKANGARIIDLSNNQKSFTYPLADHIDDELVIIKFSEGQKYHKFVSPENMERLFYLTYDELLLFVKICSEIGETEEDDPLSQIFDSIFSAARPATKPIIDTVMDFLNSIPNVEIENNAGTAADSRQHETRSTNRKESKAGPGQHQDRNSAFLTMLSEQAKNGDLSIIDVMSAYFSVFNDVKPREDKHADIDSRIAEHAKTRK